MRILTSITLLLFVTLMLSGCTFKQNRGTVPVNVTIRYKGEPVHEAVIVFFAEQHYANGLTDASGLARMMTFEVNDGAIPDAYRVTVLKQQLIEKYDPNKPAGENVISSETKYFVPAKYGDPATSGLTVNVTKDGKNDFVFDLED